VWGSHLANQPFGASALPEPTPTLPRSGGAPTPVQHLLWALKNGRSLEGAALQAKMPEEMARAVASSPLSKALIKWTP